MDAHCLAASFVTHLNWVAVADFRALAQTFSQNAEPEEADLSDDARVKVAAWRSRAGLIAARSVAERIARRCAQIKADILHPHHADYPSAFAGLAKPPIFLSRLGGAPWIDRATLSIFGARDPSPQAIAWMETHLPELLRRDDLCVASGGARGIDRRAHGLALACGRPTVIFLPSGLGSPYPADLASWFARVTEGGGAVLSEFAPDQQVRRANFERRNRMIAALGCASFAVEGRRRSGTLMTARLAMELGREVCALPACALDPRAAGTVDLLRDGAQLIRDADDLRELVTAEQSRWRFTASR